MCLLSFVKLEHKTVFTSNRDINVSRPPAESISTHIVNEEELSFPKDYKGGSWLVHDATKIMIVLNGAEKNHLPGGTYGKSRGLILLDIVTQKDSMAYWHSLNLEGIEPFTLVYLDGADKLFQLSWDEHTKKSLSLDANKNKIWMSSTLYTDEEKNQLARKFQETSIRTLEEALDFNRVNHYAEIKSDDTRIPTVETVSLHQIIKQPNGITCNEYLPQ